MSRHPSFFNPPPSPPSFGVACGLDGHFLSFIKVKLNIILILFDRCGKNPVVTYGLMFSGGPGILSSSFFFNFLIGDVFQQPGNDKEWGGGVLTHPDERTRVSECVFTATCLFLSLLSVSLSQALASYRVYLLTARIPAKVRTAVDSCLFWGGRGLVNEWLLIMNTVFSPHDFENIYGR